MAVGSTALLVGGLALAAIGTGVQFTQQRKAQKEQEKAAEAAQRARELEARRQRRRVLREQRIARAELLNIGAQTGAAGGSGEAGGISSLASQAGFELGFSRKTELLGNEVTRRNISAARAQGRAAIGGAVAGLGGQIAGFGASGGTIGTPRPQPSSTGFFRFGQFAGTGRTPGGF